jgi:hypothetical protein
MLLLVLLGGAAVILNVAFFRRVSSEDEDDADAPVPSLEQDARFAESLWHIASDCPTPRGIVLPLFDDIATLGISLILELREMGVALPIEIPHCGDLNPALYEQLVQQDRRVRVYDVCVQASSKVDATTGQPLFCMDLAHCHKKFRSFDIKVLAVVLSRFQELMLLDADTLFFQNPMDLWATPKYQQTGTLFFRDRISYERSYLAKRTVDGRERIAAIHDFLSKFEVSPYKTLTSIARPPSVLAKLSPVPLSFEPSDELLQSHAWALRAGHQMDSSLVLWDKRRQPRATVILASFVARNGRTTPPSYGDKELYFLACELAETKYAFSDHAVGTIGVDIITDAGDDQSVICGDALHYFPEPVTRGLEPRPLYMNSDSILEWGSETKPIYRTKALPAWYYPGSFTDRGLSQVCPFNVSLVPLMDVEAALLARRYQLHQTAETWAETSGFVKPAKKGLWRRFFG